MEVIVFINVKFQSEKKNGLNSPTFTIFTAVNVMEFHLKSTWNSAINVKEIYKYTIKHNSTVISSTQLSDFPRQFYLHTKID